jgi:arylsulfatase
VRDYVFAEHNWHVFQAHERMVRWKDWVLIRNGYPERQNLCMEGDPSHPAGAELWEMETAGKLNKDQRDIFLKPRPALELYNVSKDPHQLRNLAADKKFAPVMSDLVRVLDRWAEDTGDTVPKNPTNDRQDPYKKKYKNHKRGTMPGTERGATKINRPGPIKEQ